MRRLTKGLLGVAILAFLLSAASAARADEFNFTYNGGGGTDVITGVLTTTAFSGGKATITGISGFYNGSAITALLPPGTCCLSPANDNFLFFPGPPFLDIAGFGFQVGSIDLNVYLFVGPSEYGNLTAPSGSPNNITERSAVTLSVTPTPEPTTIGLLRTGLIGVFLKKRKRA